MSVPFRRLAAAALALFIVSGVSTLAAPQENADALFQEARRLFDALDYEKAVVALDQAIAALQPSAATDSARRGRLAAAYEMRARSKFGLGDQDGAKADFVQLLKLEPGHALGGQVSPRVVTLFEQTVKETVTNLTIALTPATAKLSLDGTPLPGPGTIRVTVGEHVVTAEQAGYRAGRETVTAAADATAEVKIDLERTSSILRVVTTPADVEVKVDGKVAGRTAAGPDAAAASAPLIIGDVTTGSHTVELARDCYVPVTQRVEVEKPDDYAVGPVMLRPAVASIQVSANQPGAKVFVDGRERGVAPLTIADVCQGEHLVELRSRFGSDSRRIDVRAGNDVALEGVLKPLFAIVSTSGPASSQDLRVVVQRALAGSRSVALVAPPADEADKALKASQLPADWLATDAAGRPLGAAAQIAGPLRKEVSTTLSDTFRSQGIASVTAVDGSRVVVSLLSAGSITPDAIDITLDSPSSIAAAVEKLDRGVPLSRTSIGLQVIDVADVPGPVIVGVDANGPAAAVAKAGDIVLQADGKPVGDVAALAAAVAAHRPDDAMELDMRDAAGQPRHASVKVTRTPRLIGLSEQGVLANRVLLDLRSRVADATDPFDQSAMRLNIAVALARLGDWAAAREELQRVKLPDVHGVGEGTVQYLLGLAAENLGNRAEAEAAFKAAAASESLLSEDGPAVKELAEARLAGLQKKAGH
jgi:tetratricopeptide (TPR) repeat protein